MSTIPVSVIIPTYDRPDALARSLASLLASSAVPDEFVIVDASTGRETADAVRALFASKDGGPRAIVRQAERIGAAAQRNQAFALATNDYVLFCDDDIVCEPDCIERLWNAMQADSGIGGANATIVNQKYARPGRLLRLLLAAMGEREMESYAGRIVGPAIHFLPRDGAGLPAAVPVQWLNTTCVLYRRAHLPDPPFDSFFTGYSAGEDFALSLRVAKKARLVNVPAARIVHNSQPGAHKADEVALGRMHLVNTHFILTQVMAQRRWRDHAKLMLWECCQLGICGLQERGGAVFWKRLWGRLLGLSDIVRGRGARNAA